VHGAYIGNYVMTLFLFVVLYILLLLMLEHCCSTNQLNMIRNFMTCAA